MEDEGFYCLVSTATSNKSSLLSRIRSLALVWYCARNGLKACSTTKQICGVAGVRTLSDQNPAYNPISYQLGSVWPHDNAFVAAGLKRYGYHQEANQIAEGIFAAASYFESRRMPELLPELNAKLKASRTLPDANVPQAWLLERLLAYHHHPRPRADAPHRRLRVQPSLPEWLADVELTNLTVEMRLLPRFWREEEENTMESHS